VGTDAILGLGIQGVVTYILILIMKNNHSKDMKQLEQTHEKEKQDIQVDIMRVESHKQDIDKLCEKMDRMIDAIHEIVTKDTQRMTRLEQEAESIKDMYIRTATKIAEIHKKTIEIRALVSLCPNANKEIEERKKQ